MIFPVDGVGRCFGVCAETALASFINCFSNYNLVSNMICAQMRSFWVVMIVLVIVKLREWAHAV